MQGPRIFTGFKTIFKAIDTNNSGTIDLKEFTTALLNLKLEITEEDARRLFNAIDRNGNGALDYVEFLDLMRTPLSQQRLALVQRAFMRLDVNRMGQVDIRDLKKAFNS